MATLDQRVRPVSTAGMAVVLAGGLKASPLQEELGSHSVLDLPMGLGGTVLSTLLETIARDWAHREGSLPVSVVWGAPVPAPAFVEVPGGIRARVMQEPRPWRGPAGVARDVCEHLEEHALILVVEGARWAGAPLSGLFDAMERTGADVVIGCNPDESPAGVYLMRQRSLMTVPRQGFMDLKEQLLPRLTAAGGTVMVHALPSPGVLRLRTRVEYLQSVARTLGEGPGWLLRDVRATLDNSALTHESVLMADSVVSAGAVVARSIVLPGAVVGPGEHAVDTIVGAGVRQGTRGAPRSRQGAEP